MTEESQDRAIGRIEGKLDLIIAEQERAAAGRKQQYEKHEQLDRKVEAAYTKLSSVDARLQNVEGPVAEFSKWRERGIGAVMLVSFAAASVGGLIVTLWGKLVALFNS
jgi:hypothetical protein